MVLSALCPVNLAENFMRTLAREPFFFFHTFKNTHVLCVRAENVHVQDIYRCQSNVTTKKGKKKHNPAIMSKCGSVF